MTYVSIDQFKLKEIWATTKNLVYFFSKNKFFKLK